MIFSRLLLSSFAFLSVQAEKVSFFIHKNSSTFEWKSGTSLRIEDCDPNGKFSFVAHGWRGSKAPWIARLIEELLKHRGGCVIFMDWGAISDDINYDLIVLFEFRKVSNALLSRLHQLELEGVDERNIFMYGHSLGGRLVIDAGIRFGQERIGEIHGKAKSWKLEKFKKSFPACDSADPGFLLYDLLFDSKLAAQNVQCIHTSIDAGTSIYNCHQDWLMGL